jgi:serine/threonine protein kinase
LDGQEGRANIADLTGKTLGNYRIMERIGRGGMATVYKAYQPALERYVAIKVIHEQLAAGDERFLKRFQREAKAVASLRHPNIVQVFDFGTEDDVAYMVMEYLEGTTLKAELKALAERDETIPLEEAQRIFQAVASAVEHAHRQGMVHRDIKPANVMLTAKGDVFLTDFGIAKIVGGTQYTATGAITGTPAYMSPEQGQGERGDERSDIYALGVMLYEVVTGRVPFDADTPLAVILKHISAPLPLPRQLNPAIPEMVEQVVLKALAKDPNDRYQTVAQMASALEAALAGEAVPVRERRPPELAVAPPAPRAGLCCGRPSGWGWWEWGFWPWPSPSWPLEASPCWHDGPLPHLRSRRRLQCRWCCPRRRRRPHPSPRSRLPQHRWKRRQLRSRPPQRLHRPLQLPRPPSRRRGPSIYTIRKVWNR